jgi:heme A synthase
MKHPLFILIGALALGAAIFAGAYFASQRATLMCCENPTDDLSWLKMEFKLSEAELTRIRELHAGYLPKCVELCRQIAAAKRELAAIVGSNTNLTVQAQARLNEIAALRAECQSNMIQHFVTVSQAMPPAQGSRYLAEMKKLTLGGHEQVEKSMSGDSCHEHQH